MAENFYLTVHMHHTKWYRRPALREMANTCQAQFDRMGITIDPYAHVSGLGVGQRQLLRIVSAVASNPSLLLLDEPYSMLPRVEVERFNALFSRLRGMGMAILFVTHDIGDALSLCDELTVLKDGRVVAHAPAGEADVQSLLQVIGDYGTPHRYPRLPQSGGRPVLSAQQLSTADRHLSQVSFTLHRGEILGVAGLLGAGRTALSNVLFGAERVSQGRLVLDGRAVRFQSPHDAISNGIGLIPENRQKNGLIEKFPLPYNLTLSNLGKVSDHAFLSRRRENDAARQAIKRYAIRTHAFDDCTMHLSGGNQQKVVLSKWMFSGCSILIMDDPTNSIDVSAKVDFYNFMNKFTMEGGSILFISSDFDELLGMSDRILVIRNGRITRTLEREEFSMPRLLNLLTCERDPPSAPG